MLPSLEKEGSRDGPVSVLSEESKRCSYRIIPDRRCELIICGGKEVLTFYRIGLFLSKNHGFRPEFNGLSLSLDVPRVQLPPFLEMPVPSEFLFGAPTLLDKIDFQW